MRPAPDVAGFADAQRHLRAKLGQDVIFVIPAAATYDGEADPETGTPYDPWGNPSSGGGAPTEVVKRVSVISPLSSVSDTAQSTPIGVIAADHVAVILDEQDWPDVEAATHVVLNGERFKITDARPDARSTLYARRLIYLART